MVTIHLNIIVLQSCVVLPVLRKQEGFKDEIFFTSQDGKEAIGIGLWDKTYDVATSTIYRAAAQPTV